ncbi:MAG: response regulator [Deltaproteobacteria bacterium]|nr:response regulator [Deltaproteobacteria bacterium]
MSAEDANEQRIAALERELEALKASRARERASFGEGSFGEGLREREALLSEAERIVHLGCWMWDTSTGAIRWSDELFRIFGLSPGSLALTPETFFDRIHPEDVARVREAGARMLASRTTEAIDFRIVRSDGTARRVHMESALLDADPGLRLVGTVLDVTERLAMEERLQHAQKMEALGTLASGVAHDFNNYLQVVFGHLDLVALRTLDSDVRGSVGQIRDAAERCRRLTRQLLVFGRAGSAQHGRGEPDEPEVVSIDPLLDQASPIFAALLGDRIRLRRVRAEEDVRVACERGGLEQLVLNLLVNARDAMPDGGRITIDLSTRDVGAGHATLARGRYAVLAIEDEGGGIAPEHLPRIFEPFFSTKGLATGPSGGSGTGLGLAVVHGIVTRHHGAIEVESVPGRSATFRVLLPIAGRPTRATESQRPTPPMVARGLVLVVEDQDAVRSLVRTLLTSEGFAVLEAVDGLAALELLRHRADVDLVLSDIAMPRMTGVELVRETQRERPSLPVVLMGGVVDSNVAGIEVEVLHKPFGRDELLRVVSKALTERKPASLG